MYDAQGDELKPPKKGALSLWINNKLKTINLAELHKVRISGRVLDHIFNLKAIAIPPMALLPTASSLAMPDPQVIFYPAKTEPQEATALVHTQPAYAGATDPQTYKP